MNEERKIVVNAIITPDGTRIQSNYQHDFKIHKDKNGYEYSVDGGRKSLDRSFPIVDYTEASLYTDDPIEEIRKFLFRGGYGKDMKGKYREVKLQDMSNDWVKAVIVYENEHRPRNYLIPIYEAELKYREENNIKIEDNE